MSESLAEVKKFQPDIELRYEHRLELMGY